MTDEDEVDELLKDSEGEIGEVARLILRERRIARSIMYTTWGLGIIVAIVGVVFSGWVWLIVLAVPIVNALVVNNAYHRIARETGLDPKVVHQLWRQSQNIEIEGD